MNDIRSLAYAPFPVRALIVLGVSVGAPLSALLAVVTLVPVLPEAARNTLLLIDVSAFVALPAIVLIGAAVAASRARDEERRKVHLGTGFAAVLAFGVVGLLALALKVLVSGWC